MTRDEIIKMAREAGWTNYDSQDERFEHFARAAYAAGAAAMQEACARRCESEGSVDDLPMHYAAAIRAMGKK